MTEECSTSTTLTGYKGIKLKNYNIRIRNSKSLTLMLKTNHIDLNTIYELLH